MQRGTTTMDRELPVKLAPEEIQARGESLAAKMLRVKTLRKKRREEYKNATAQIDAELDNMEQIAETIVQGTEARKQGDLFVEQVQKAEAPEILGAVAEGIVAEGVAVEEPKYHRDGKRCENDRCRGRRRHMNREQLLANEIVPEGEEIGSVPQGDAAPPATICAGCEKALEGVERIKGLCEACQLAKPGDALGQVIDTEASGAGDVPPDLEAPIDGIPSESDEDPRPRCQGCSEVLHADDIEKGLGLCQPCINEAGGEAPVDLGQLPHEGEPTMGDVETAGGEAETNA